MPPQFGYNPYLPLPLNLDAGSPLAGLATALTPSGGAAPTQMPQRPTPAPALLPSAGQAMTPYDVLPIGQPPSLPSLPDAWAPGSGRPIQPQNDSAAFFARSPAQAVGEAVRPFAKIADIPGAVTRNVLAGRPWEEGAHPLDEGDAASGRDVLRSWGAVGPQDDWTNAAMGAAAEFALDPTNVVGAGMVKPLQKAARGLSPKYSGGVEKFVDAARRGGRVNLDAPAPPGGVVPKTPGLYGDDLARTYVDLGTSDLDADVFGDLRSQGRAMPGGPTEMYGPGDARPGLQAKPSANIVPGTERVFDRFDHGERQLAIQGQTPYVNARFSAAQELALPTEALGRQNRLMQVFEEEPETLRRVLEELPPGSTMLGRGGMEGIAWQTPQGDVLRVGTTGLNDAGDATAWSTVGRARPMPRINDPSVTQPTRAIPIGSVMLERLPYVEPISGHGPGRIASGADVLAMRQGMADRGLHLGDPHSGNIGYRTNPNTGDRLSNTPEVLDPGGIVRMGPNAPSFGGVTPNWLTPAMEQSGAGSLYAPYVRELNNQTAARGLGAASDWRAALRQEAADPLVRALAGRAALVASGQLGRQQP